MPRTSFDGESATGSSEESTTTSYSPKRDSPTTFKRYGSLAGESRADYGDFNDSLSYSTGYSSYGYSYGSSYLGNAQANDDDSKNTYKVIQLTGNPASACNGGILGFVYTYEIKKRRRIVKRATQPTINIVVKNANECASPRKSKEMELKPLEASITSDATDDYYNYSPSPTQTRTRDTTIFSKSKTTTQPSSKWATQTKSTSKPAFRSMSMVKPSIFSRARAKSSVKSKNWTMPTGTDTSTYY